MGKARNLFDGLANALSGTGTSKDKAAHNRYSGGHLTSQELMDAYRYAWLPRKIVDMPALDATRAWREWQAETSDISKIEAKEKELGLQAKVLEALTDSRLWGGSAIYIGTRDRDVTRQISQSAEITHLTVLTRSQITPGQLNQDPTSPNFGWPDYYTIANTSQDIHPSRLVMFKGARVPPDAMIDVESRIWGDSVLQSVYEAVSNADSTAANVASLVFEAKIDVFKIPDLMAQVNDSEYEAQLQKRLSIAQRSKSINNALVMDANEEYEQKQASFGSLKDILMAGYQLAAGAASIPMTRLVAQSASGLNSAGDNEVRDYYDNIHSSQTLEIGPALEKLDDLIIRNALGSRPSDVWYRWASLWQLDEQQTAEVGSKNAASIKSLAETGLVPDDALSRAAVTMMTESGAMPGLEAAVNDVEAEAESDDTGDGEESAIGNNVVQTRRGKVMSQDSYDPDQPRVPKGMPGAGRWVEAVLDGDDDVINDIESMMESSDYSFFGIRVDDVETPLNAGDEAPKSRIWENGDPTDELLDGTSTIGIEEDSSSISNALKSAGVTDNPKPGGVAYFGQVIYLLGGDDEEQGEDMGESIIEDAKVIATYIRSKNINGAIEYRLSGKPEA